MALLTGLFSNMIGTDWPIDPATVHGVVGLAIALVSRWNSSTIRKARGAGSASSWSGSGLLVLILVALGTGLVHSWDLTGRLGPLTVMQVHIGAAVGALALVVLHYRRYPVAVRRTDLDRRAFLSAAGLSLAAGAAWFVWEGVLRFAGSPGSARRFTGSHERGSFRPEAMPVTSWFNDEVPRLDGDVWRVRIGASTLSLAEVEALGLEELDAVLDCTSGWYSRQRWSGVRLGRLIETDSPSVRVTSVTGYGRRFPRSDLDRMWLVTRAGGEPLSPGHGFPARIVAPDRRGFWWVKWVEAVEPSESPAWLQLPFPVA
jgi:hypothetical protein